MIGSAGISYVSPPGVPRAYKFFLLISNLTVTNDRNKGSPEDFIHFIQGPLGLGLLFKETYATTILRLPEKRS